uniref:Uncharacterized protein n=1 Tax=Zea mays TaxID=4577 RepID=C0PMX0_MAIZE|nr:unknown [Zea mays]
MHRSYDQRVDILWRHLPWKALDVFYLSHVFFPVPAVGHIGAGHAVSLLRVAVAARDVAGGHPLLCVGRPWRRQGSSSARLPPEVLGPPRGPCALGLPHMELGQVRALLSRTDTWEQQGLPSHVMLSGTMRPNPHQVMQGQAQRVVQRTRRGGAS